MVPLEEHQNALKSCQKLLYDLKSVYESQLNSLNSNANETQSNLRLLTFEVAKLRAELGESRNRNDSFKRENLELKQSLIAMQTELNNSMQAKIYAEKTLAELIKVMEK